MSRFCSSERRLSSKEKAKTPLATSAGVLGMQRTTGHTPRENFFSVSRLTPAAMEISTLSALSAPFMPESTASTW